MTRNDHNPIVRGGRLAASVALACSYLVAGPALAQDFVEFTEITGEAGIATYGTTFGVAMEDLDGDADVDIFLARTPSLMTGFMAMPGTNLLFLNDGDGVFDEVGVGAGVGSACENRGLMVADHDNDGDVDFYVTVAGRNELYVNGGEALYDEVGRSAGIDHRGIGHEGAWLDYDQDGWLDLFFTNGPKEGSLTNTLYHNERNGRFRDVSAAAGVEGTVSGKGVALIDYDSDGWLDLLVTNGVDHQNFFLYENQGDGTFVEVSAEAGLEVEATEAFLSWLIPWDYDNDGWQDLMVGSHTYMHPQNTLFRNMGDGTFEDVTDLVGIHEPFNGDGTGVADYDNDGWLDVLFCLLDDECILYRNDEGQGFEPIAGNAGLNNLAEFPNWTVSTGDVNGDGFVDVYMGNGRANHPAHDHLFLNEGNGNHHLFVEVERFRGDRSGIGARVDVVTGDLVQTRYVGTRLTTFSSHGGLRLHFGVGEHEVIDEVRVTFPGGAVVSEQDVPADTTVWLVEDEEAVLVDTDRDGVPDSVDICPWTQSPAMTDARGCAAFEGGDGTEYLQLVGPADLGVIVDPPVFSWSTDLTGSTLQIDGDSAFDHDRYEIGPLTGESASLTGNDLEVLRDRFPAGRLFWRVVASTDEVTYVSRVRELGLAVEEDFVTLEHNDLNLWAPPHVVVDVGGSVQWYIPHEAEGNYNKFRHDVLIADEEGYVVARSGLMRPFDGDDEFSHTFDEPGTYYMMCTMHSWPAAGETDLEQVVGGWIDPGPYRCHAGSVTVVQP